LKAYNLCVYGKVQRVGFRRYILDLAQELSLAGQIKNLPDDSVKMFIQGDEKILLKFIELIKQPPIGIVKDVKIKEAIVKPKLKKFTIVYRKLLMNYKKALELCKKYS
jgi:acylphosphatase